MRVKHLAKHIPIYVLILLIQACATTYQPKGATGGYTDFQLNKYVYQVYFSGNGYTSKIETQRYAYIRAAEIAYENNCKYFIIINRDGSTESSIAQFGNYDSQVSQDAFGNINVRTRAPKTYKVNKHSTELVIMIVPDFVDITTIKQPLLEVETVFKSMRYDPVKKKLLD